MTTPDAGDAAISSTSRNITNIEDLMAILAPITSDGVERWYRGHRDRSWQLTPSAFRSLAHREGEEAMLARFRQEAATTGLPYGFDEWGWITYGQHHELPTRLLDWSQSPLVAIYFACEADPAGGSNPAPAGEFFVLDPRALNQDAGDADGHLRLLSEADETLSKYLPGRDGGYRQRPRAVAAPMLFDRIRFQAGTFTVEQQPRSTADEPLRSSNSLQSFTVPSDAKLRIREQLDALGFNEATIYRDLDRIARRIKNSLGGR